MSAAFVVLALLGAPPATSSAPLPRLRLEAVAEDAVQGVEPEECAEEMEKALRREKLALAAEEEEDAAILTILDCYALSKTRLRTEATQGAKRLPVPGKHVHQSDQEYAAETRTTRAAGFTVRLACGDRFTSLSSPPSEERLDRAARSTAARVRRWLEDGACPRPPE